jgi:hypothetical protein
VGRNPKDEVYWQARAAMAPSELIAEVLENGAGRLGVSGWRRGLLGGPAGPNCTSGAIYHATLAVLADLGQEGWKFYQLYDAAFAAVVLHLNKGISTWNDQDCADGGEAAELLRTVAKDIRNTGGVRSDAIHV